MQTSNLKNYNVRKKTFGSKPNKQTHAFCHPSSNNTVQQAVTKMQCIVEVKSEIKVNLLL
jgi:hypothetical protein